MLWPGMQAVLWGDTLAHMREEDKQNATQWVRHHTQPCPGCGSRIQKNGGCNHMSCSVCRQQFCWVCSPLLRPSHVEWTSIRNAVAYCPMLCIITAFAACSLHCHIHIMLYNSNRNRLQPIVVLRCVPLQGKPNLQPRYVTRLQLPVLLVCYADAIICCLLGCRSVEVTGQNTAQTPAAISGAT